MVNEFMEVINIDEENINENEKVNKSYYYFY